MRTKHKLCEHGQIAYTCRKCKGAGVCQHDHQRLHCVICSPASVHRKYQRDAVRFSRVFTLTVEEFIFITRQPCFYCGESTQQRGIDRWDNTKGYILSNCLPCCKVCNLMKKVLSIREFISKAREIAKRHPFT